MAAEESDLNFKKNPCRSVSIRVPFRCDVSVLRRGSGAVNRIRSSIAVGHGLHGWSRIIDRVESDTGSKFNFVTT